MKEENKEKIKKGIVILFLIYLMISIPLYDIYLIITTQSLGGWDFEVHYIPAYLRFLKNLNFYKEGFVYFPSFFLLFQFISKEVIFIYFLISCMFLSIPLMIRLKLNTALICTLFLIQIGRIHILNVDPFIFLIILVCLNLNTLKNKYVKLFVPIFLAFISFKPSVIIILPYFLYRSENRLRFALVYCLSFICFNYYFLLNPQFINYFVEYAIRFITFNTKYKKNRGIFASFRFWFIFVYYYFLAEEQRI